MSSYGCTLVQLFAPRLHIRIRFGLQCINRQSQFLPCSLTSLHVFTAVACSVLPAFCVILYYPTCSLYPPTSYSFPSVTWSHCSSRLSSSWSIPCCPIPPISQCLRKPPVLSVFLHFSPEAYASASFLSSTLSRSSLSALSFCFLAPPTQRSAVFSLASNYQSTVNLEFPTSRSVHIYPLD